LQKARSLIRSLGAQDGSAKEMTRTED